MGRLDRLDHFDTFQRNGLAIQALEQARAAAEVAVPDAVDEVLGEEVPLVRLQGEVVKQTFTLRNSGKADLHVTDVKPACGCTASDYDKVIKPGLLGKISHVEICCYYQMRSRDSSPATGMPPENLDYEMWTGPARKLPFHKIMHPRGGRKSVV